MASAIYKLTLAKTYYNNGYFNIGVDSEGLVRPDSGPIKIFLGDSKQEIAGHVNRNANQNGTPRIFGGAKLRKWFQKNFKEMDRVEVFINNPKEIWFKGSTNKKNDLSGDFRNPASVNKTPNRSGVETLANFQRIGSISNTYVGQEFEPFALEFFATQGLNLTRHYKIFIGVEDKKKEHMFDLGSENPKIIVECKSHRWTTGNNVPSAKMTVWNEVMYYFSIAPKDCRKILFVLRDFNETRQETLAGYYLRTYEHLIPSGVEIWEYDSTLGNAFKVKGTSKQ